MESPLRQPDSTRLAGGWVRGFSLSDEVIKQGIDLK